MNYIAKSILFCIFFFASAREVQSQTYKTHHRTIRKLATVNPKQIQPDFNAQLNNLERPLPDGESIRSHIMRQKMESRKRFPIRSSNAKTNGADSNFAASPRILSTWGMKRELSNGTQFNIQGGIPNDNTLAVSDSGIVLAGINSLLYGWNIPDSSKVFTNYFISLFALGGGGPADSYYDPKIIYDEQADRFILVFLKNFDPQTNGYIVCFSTTNDPTDDWNVYFIDGNPLDNNRWTDFPAISIANDELFITGNLIVPDVSWQIGFDGSVIWQVSKEDGYAGADTLNHRVFTDIRYNGRFIRNLHPVQGARGVAQEQYFLSNRNFDVQNDTVFVLKMNSALDEEQELSIKAIRTDLPYGMPPNGRQADTDTTDATGGLQTNDARVLAALYYDEKIQYVANCINPTTGLSCIYHGFMQNPGGETSIRGRYIADEHLDFGYPNIALCGNEYCEPEAMIGFNYAAPDSFPGVAMVYFSNDSLYSDLKIIKTGENYVDRLPGAYERWGDYFGLQRWHARKNEAVLVGYYGLTSRGNGSWLAHVQSPDSSKLIATIGVNEENQPCSAIAGAEISGGIPPYSINWNNGSGSTTINGICDGETLILTVTDSRGCTTSDSLIYKASASTTGLFPNPSNALTTLRFELESDIKIKASVYDLGGRLVARIAERNAKKGLNELVFSTEPLADGIYSVRIETENSILVSERLLKATAK
jgi:hypothetical protein